MSFRAKPALVFLAVVALASCGGHFTLDDSFNNQPLPRFDIQVASVSSTGAATDLGSALPAMSANGRFVAFVSSATNLVANDANGQTPDIFLRDTCLLTANCIPSTVLVSVATDGTQGNRENVFVAISGNGRFVAFTSLADNLVPGDTNQRPDVFLRDTCFGVQPCSPSTVRVSVASDGSEGNDTSGWGISISHDGRFVAFITAASNLADVGVNSAQQVLVRDTCVGAANCTPETKIASAAQNGGVSNGFAQTTAYPTTAISADGRYVAFVSTADNLVPGDTNQLPDVFLRDTCQNALFCTPSTIRVSVASDGSSAAGSSFAVSMSSDARVVVFTSTASNIATIPPQDPPNQIGLFWRDTCIGAEACFPNTHFVARGEVPVVSGNGRFVAFASINRQLTAPEALRPNIYAYDSCFQTASCSRGFRRVSVSATGEEHNGFIENAIFEFWPLAISSSGHAIAFTCSANNLVPSGPQNVTSNVFLAPSRF
ncbi:MAG: hypothetical protein L0Z53_03145 [Acidobacteriales bacterium]|nr:hypothetical protein [Terriglobales bacterium]